MQRLILFILFALSALTVCIAQKITGKVTDYKSGEALAYVNVHYDGTTIGVNTDAEGHYSIKKMVGKKRAPMIGMLLDKKVLAKKF